MATRRLEDDLESVLLTEEQISRRVAELGARISQDYAGRDLVLIGILRGALLFLSDLTRAITIPHAFDLVGASSYRGGTASSGFLRITKDVDSNLEGRDALIIEDIYDSGKTFAVVRDLIQVHKPRSVELCAILRKQVPHREMELDVKYIGFDIPDKFVVGYGLDYQEHYRNLRMVGVLSPSVYAPKG